MIYERTDSRTVFKLGNDVVHSKHHIPTTYTLNHCAFLYAIWTYKPRMFKFGVHVCSK